MRTIHPARQQGIKSESTLKLFQLTAERDSPRYRLENQSRHHSPQWLVLTYLSVTSDLT